MPKPRPTSVLVIAILHLIFGGFGLLCGLCAGVGQFLELEKRLAKMGDPARMRQVEARKELTEKILQEKVPYYKAYTAVNVGLNWLFSFALVAAGVGLLRMQGWARILSILYAITSILRGVLALFYGVLFLGPTYEEVFRQMPLPPEEGGELVQTFSKVAEVLFPLLLMIYPLVVLIIMLRRSVAAAFRGEVPEPAPEEYYDPPQPDVR